MPTKEQLSQEINEVLGTEVSWEKLSKEDLQLFHELVNQGLLVEPLAKHMVKEHGRKKLDEQVDDWYPGKYAKELM